MIRSNACTEIRGTRAQGLHRLCGRIQLLYLIRPRLLTNLLALVALFSIGFV